MNNWNLLFSWFIIIAAISKDVSVVSDGIIIVFDVIVVLDGIIAVLNW